MTSSTLLRFGEPATARAARALDSLAARAADVLAGRTVWSAGVHRAEPAERPLDLGGAEPLARLSDCVNALLRGDVTPAGRPLRDLERELCAESEERSEEMLGRDVRPGDVVVLHDPVTVTLARAIKERGAHALWCFERPSIGADWTLMRGHTSASDGYLVTLRAPGPGGFAVERTVALVPARDAVIAAEVFTTGERERWQSLGWTSVLADLVELDRDDSVGGMLHARPSVAPR